MEQFQAAVELEPDNAGIFLEIGKTYHTQGKYDEALYWCKKGLKLSPEDVPILIELGEIYLELGDCKHAETSFSRVLEIQPDNTIAKHGILTCASS
jgi:tetratricopeptide (TPR) repeat protein